MEQPGPWLALVLLLGIVSAGTADLSSPGGTNSLCLCLIACLPGQRPMAGFCLQWPSGFYSLAVTTGLWPHHTGTCRGSLRLARGTDCQCPPEQKPSPQHAGCVFCPVGYFFSGSSPCCWSCLPGTKWGTQLLCPAGTYSPQTGSAQLEDCAPCPPGAFCPDGTTEPVPCPRGTYCQGAGARMAAACAPCPEGHHCPEPGTIMPQPCHAGSFSGPGSLRCQDCPGGNLCNRTRMAGPTACPPGHYCPAPGLLSIPCPQGTFREAPGAARLEDCQMCPPGAFCGRTGLTKPQGLCNPGYHCGPGSTIASPEGLPFGDLCPPGHFCPAGTKDPREWPCPAGTWNAKRGARDVSWCLPCPPGLFCALEGQVAPGGLCAAGSHCPGGACIPRPPGMLWEDLEDSLRATAQIDREHSKDTGQETYQEKTCSLAHFCPQGTSSPQQVRGQGQDCPLCPAGTKVTHPDGGVPETAGGPCPPGHFCPVGTGVPLPCPVGTFSDRMFLSMASECLSCPPGHFCAASGLTAPSGPCSPGYFCLAGVSSPTPTGHSEQGGPCPPGHFCPQGTSFPQPCPAGSYSSLPGQASCFPCPAGYYCPENTTHYLRLPCPAGFYCPRGTRYATQFPCPRGYYNPESLTQSLDSCLPCPPGHYCGQENLTQPSGPCDPGWFCVSAAWTARPFDLDNYTSSNCLCPATATGGKCPAGSYCPEGSPEPTSCPPGSFCATSGLSAPSGPCQAGYFCAEGAASSAPEDGVMGAPCPPGSFCSAGSHRPTLCPAGTFSSLPKQLGPSACQDCPSGFYCKEAGLQAPSGQCPAGYYCDSSGGPVLDFSLFPCPHGYYCPLGTAKATRYSCPVGTYGPRKGLMSVTECQLCPAGKFCALAGLTEPTGNCAAGHWCKRGATSKDPTDRARGLLCPPGHYCLEGTPVPARCPPGTWSEEGTGAPEGCHECSPGQPCSGGRPPIQPAPCDPGVSCMGGPVPGTPTEGLSGRSCPPGHLCPGGMVGPTPCPPGSYAPGPHAMECHVCPPGHYCAPGLQPRLCPRGFYCPEGTGLDWQPCPPGTYSPVPGLSNLLGCRACDGGRFCPWANATVAGGQCWEGFFCSRGSTRPNPEMGTEEGAGPCPRGYYCSRGSAVPQPCPAGTFGSQVKLGSEEACSPCLPGHYCSSPGLPRPSGPCSEGFFCLQGALVPNNSLGDGTSGPCPTGHFCPPGTATPRPCPAGSHNALMAQGRCKPCPQGFFCPANTSSMLGNECPAGHYCPAATAFASQFPCPRGSYKPQTGGVQRSDCTHCEPGSYCDLPGLAAPSGPCRAGFYCTHGALVSNPIDGVTGDFCPPGHFCPQGSPQPTPCPPGSFLPTRGATSKQSCQPCRAGWYCSRAGLSSPEAPCEGGWYCPRTSVSGHSPDALCPPGHACPPGSVAPRLCPAGQYQDEPGQSVCKTCPAGKFCPFGIQGSWPVWPVDCPAGYYCPLGTQSPTQHPCPGGTFRERPGARSVKDCRPCPAGHFCTDSGTGNRLPNGPCFSGYYCPPGQTSATPPSFRCPRGFYCPEGSSQPRACENGTFQPLEAQGTCKPCPEGFYCEASGSAHSPSLCLQGYFCPQGSHSATAHPCPQGTFGPRRGAAAEVDCELCPAGRFCSSEGLPQPSGLCHSGHYCTGGAVSPTPIRHKVEAPGLSGNDICPPGFFCPRGTSSPVPCPPGFYSSLPGLHSEDQCQPCPAGRYCSQPGLSRVLDTELCDAGYICLGGSTNPSPSDPTQGYRCPPGFRCPPGAHRELSCEPGTFSPLPGADSCWLCPEGTSCPQAATVEPTTCPAGHYCPAGTASARPCPEGTLNPREGAFSSGACQPCPAGKYCPGEGNGQPEGPCAAGYYCEGGAASPTPWGNPAFPLNGPCPRGHYCPQGTLYPVPCPPGTIRSSPGGSSEGSCRPCPAGSFCPSLSLSSPNGTCSADSSCPSDPRTSSPTAFPCPQGHFCQIGAAWPSPCHHGLYQPALGSDTCLPCPPGSFCPHPGTTVPRLCPAHTYCPAGTWAPTLCPPGTFTPQGVSGLQEERACSICPPGHYCREGQVWGKCPAGYFCPPGTSEVTPPGSRQPAAPCPQRQQCAEQCPPGSYCPEASGKPTLCPPHTLAAAPGATRREDCGHCPPGHWCTAGALAVRPCPAGYFCPGGSGTSPGSPQACPEHTYLADEGGQSEAECIPCPAGYHCPRPGLSSFKDHPCPPGYWCPGAQAPLLCPPGTFRTQPGAAVQEDCQLCPPGFHCPDAELRGRANVFATPCRAGFECPEGAVAEVPCRAGCYCGPQTGVPPLCPGGYVCPMGSSTYTGLGQRCVFPHYCPPGSALPRACPGGSEALNGSGLRVSQETCCRLCAAGTYRGQALDALPCQPCPPGFSCPQGSESYHSQPCPVGHYCPAGTRSPRPCPEGTFRGSSQAHTAGDCSPCPTGTFSSLPGQASCLPCGSSAFSAPGASLCTCRGLNRIFQKSDGSCICQAGYVSYDSRGLESDQDSNSDEDCQPRVAKRCSPGDVRLAATRECVSPHQHNCSSFCLPGGGELSMELGICQCRVYVSAEEICDAQCLASAPRLSLAQGPSRKLILNVMSQAGDSIQREVLGTLGPAQLFPASARVHLVQFGPQGVFGFIVSTADVLSPFLQGPLEKSPPRQWNSRTKGPRPLNTEHPGIGPRIPNPVVCLVVGDVILFQLHILPRNRSASHFPVYQRQHLFNSNPHWDFGAFRRLGLLVRETHLHFSRFAHQFLDPGTYVFQDNGRPESTAVVQVKEEGVACGPGLSPVQPPSPYQLGRLGILRHGPANLGPDWTAITGTLLATGLATTLLTGLVLLLRPPVPQVCPMRAWKPQWRSLGQPAAPAECILLRDSLVIYEDLGAWSSGKGADFKEKAVTQGTGVPVLAQTLEDFSIRTLYDKLEDQSLHMAAQLSKHRRDALAFYKTASQQLRGLQDFLQGLHASGLQALVRGQDSEKVDKATAQTDTQQREEPGSSHTAASTPECQQPPPGGIPSTSPPGFQLELNRAIAALASALSHACWPSVEAGRKASNQLAEQTLSTSQPDMLLMAQPPPSDQFISPQQDTGPTWHPQGNGKGGAAQRPGPEEWICWAGPDHRALPELKRKIQQVEDTMDELNEEFLQLSAQALELQKEETEPDQLLAGEGDTFVMAPGISPGVWQEGRLNPEETSSPGREELRTQVLQSEQALVLEVRRIHLAQKIEDLEWELSLLLQAAADGSTNLGSPGSPESLRTQQWPPVGRAFPTKDMTRFPW